MVAAPRRPALVLLGAGIVVVYNSLSFVSSLNFCHCQLAKTCMFEASPQLSMNTNMARQNKVLKSTTVAAWLFGALTLGRLVHEYVPIGASQHQPRRLTTSTDRAAAQTIPPAVQHVASHRQSAADSAFPDFSSFSSGVLCGALAAAMLAFGAVTMDFAAKYFPVQLAAQTRVALKQQATQLAKTNVVGVNLLEPQRAKDILPCAAIGAAVLAQGFAQPGAESSEVARKGSSAVSAPSGQAQRLRLGPGSTLHPAASHRSAPAWKQMVKLGKSSRRPVAASIDDDNASALRKFLLDV
eukprot:TRINITY_DN87058_c0_g1_i1.p1 TRINITY_DN87058_c0_g1~~TRINITY_DN87058_c0_g1_i1.p1  ORF type:complete len:297 (+),score=49.32 TRINITY_DN87058_c0_g1_i1:19-909(+)